MHIYHTLHPKRIKEITIITIKKYILKFVSVCISVTLKKYKLHFIELKNINNADNKCYLFYLLIIIL